MKIWDILDPELPKLICTLRNTSNDTKDIEEYFCGVFIEPQTADTVTESNLLLAVGGKRKNRHQWSVEDDDNQILPCHIQIFDVSSGKVVCQLEGHMEEILSIHSYTAKDGANYLISTSQDGMIYKWRMAADWKSCLGSFKFEDEECCLVFNIAFVPSVGECDSKEKLFLAACDDGIRLWDFEREKLVLYFEDKSYSSYCDDIAFVGLNGASSTTDAWKGLQELPNGQHYVVTRGVELVQPENPTQPITPNSLTLHTLAQSNEASDSEGKTSSWSLVPVFKYSHMEYTSNSWYLKFANNGRYLFAPTTNGKVFIFAIGSGALTGVLADHEDFEVRQVLLHSEKPLLFTCGDDGNVFFYSY